LNVNVYVFIKHKAGNAIKECIMKSTSKLKAIRKIAGIIAFVAIIGISMTACNNGSSGGGGDGGNPGDNTGGGDKWSLLVGEWEWEEGSSSIWLEFDSEEMGIMKHPRYHFLVGYDFPGSMGGSNVFWCTYDGATLKIMDYDDTLEHSFTVTLLNSNTTLTFSNYKKVGSGSSDYSYLSGKNFLKQ
jgi:predicted small secreted protein